MVHVCACSVHRMFFCDRGSKIKRKQDYVITVSYPVLCASECCVLRAVRCWGRVDFCVPAVLLLADQYSYGTLSRALFTDFPCRSLFGGDPGWCAHCMGTPRQRRTLLSLDLQSLPDDCW